MKQPAKRLLSILHNRPFAAPAAHLRRCDAEFHSFGSRFGGCRSIHRRTLGIETSFVLRSCSASFRFGNRGNRRAGGMKQIVAQHWAALLPLIFRSAVYASHLTARCQQVRRGGDERPVRLPAPPRRRLCVGSGKNCQGPGVCPTFVSFIIVLLPPPGLLKEITRQTIIDTV